MGLISRTPLPAGSYLLTTQLSAARKEKAGRRRLGGDRQPVEILVNGADALLSAVDGPTASKVDIVVTDEPTGAVSGRTYIAAARVPLLALRPGPEGPGPGASAAATLGLTRRQALRLIAAESFARKVTLLPGG
jgi:hypothetical protein